MNPRATHAADQSVALLVSERIEPAAVSDPVRAEIWRAQRTELASVTKIVSPSRILKSRALNIPVGAVRSST